MESHTAQRFGECTCRSVSTDFRARSIISDGIRRSEADRFRFFMTCFHYRTGTSGSAGIEKKSSCLISPNDVSGIERRVTAGADLPPLHNQALAAHHYIALHHMRTHGAINEFQLLCRRISVNSRVHCYALPQLFYERRRKNGAHGCARCVNFTTGKHDLVPGRKNSAAHYNREGQCLKPRFYFRDKDPSILAWGNFLQSITG